MAKLTWGTRARLFPRVLYGTCLAMLAVGGAVPPSPAEAGAVLDRIVERKAIRFGYRTDAPPFSSVVDGRPQGYSVDLCGRVAAAILKASDLQELTGTFTPVAAEGRFDALAEGRIDVLCGPTTATLSRREQVSFTIPVFATGVGAMLAADAPAALADPLMDALPGSLPDDAIPDALSGRRLGIRAGTTAESWLAAGEGEALGDAEIVSFDDHAAGVAAVVAGEIDVYFADQAILLGILARSEDVDRLQVSPATYTVEPYALAIPRGDEELRLVLDRALSLLFRKRAFEPLYERYFGPLTLQAQLFYRVAALPE
ncbi:MAG: amino acid ABC transporter substrate-binding protein [Pseudomonadota bacterium]